MGNKKYPLTQNMDKIYQHEYLNNLYTEVLCRFENFMQSKSDSSILKKDLNLILNLLNIEASSVKVFESNNQLLEYLAEMKDTTEKCRHYSMNTMLSEAVGDKNNQDNSKKKFLKNFNKFNRFFEGIDKEIDFINLPMEDQLEYLLDSKSSEDANFELLSLILKSERWKEFENNIKSQIGLKTMDNLLGVAATGGIEIPMDFKDKLDKIKYSKILEEVRYFKKKAPIEYGMFNNQNIYSTSNLFKIILFSSLENYLVRFNSKDRLFIQSLYRLYTNALNIFVLKGDIVYAVRKPEVKFQVKFQEHVIHSENEKAIKFPDSEGFAYYEGIRIPNWIYDQSMSEEKAKKILEIDNVSIRDFAIEVVGKENLVSYLDYQIIDEKDDYQLLLINIDNIDCEFLKMINPTTGEEHLEGILPGIKTVDQALAWRLRLDTYNDPYVKS